MEQFVTDYIDAESGEFDAMYAVVMNQIIYG